RVVAGGPVPAGIAVQVSREDGALLSQRRREQLACIWTTGRSPLGALCEDDHRQQTCRKNHDADTHGSPSLVDAAAVHSRTRSNGISARVAAARTASADGPAKRQKTTSSAGTRRTPRYRTPPVNGSSARALASRAAMSACVTPGQKHSARYSVTSTRRR